MYTSFREALFCAIQFEENFRTKWKDHLKPANGLFMKDEAIWRYSSGPGAKAIPGMNGPLLQLQLEAIWKYCNGSEAKTLPWRNH